VQVYKGDFTLNENKMFTGTTGPSLEKDYRKKLHDGLLTVISETGDVVWKEELGFHLAKEGDFEIMMGKGKLLAADKKYFGFDTNEYAVEVIKPLDYTNPMLMLSGLGVLGLLFAFLLKREDKVSGYGLEQPNKRD
jgi:hypothetical protein